MVAYVVYSSYTACKGVAIQITVNNKHAYKAFCAEQNDVPLFLKDWWLDAIGNNWDVAIVYNGDKIAGVWPYFTEEKIGVKIVRDQVLTPYTGPYVFYPHDLKPTKRDSFQHDTISQLLEQLPQAKVWHISTFPELKQTGLFKHAGFNVEPRQTFLMPLEDRIDTIFDRLHEDHRRKIRKAEQELSIEDEPQLLKDLWEYQKATLDNKDVRMHFSFEQLKALYDACSKRDCTALWVARKNGQVSAIIWHVWDRHTAYYLVGGKNPASKDYRAMTALLWHAITESKIMEKKTFDFEGSMDAGVEKFFRNFGCERTLYLVLKKNTSLRWKLKSLLR